MGRAIPYRRQSSINSIVSQLATSLRHAVGSRWAVWQIAALVVALHLPLGSARAQGYMFGRATYSVGSTGAEQASIAVGDFNGDGVVDLAVVQPSRNSVAILLGKIDGTLAAAQYYSTGVQPVAVAVGDFNRDGRQDLAIANQNCASSFYCGTNGSISILLGNEDGTFQPQKVIASGTQPTTLAIGDFNSDGKPDLVVANGATNSILALLGNGDGTFETPVPYSTPSAATFVALGDFNQDGNLDLAVGGSNPAVSIFLGKGDGTFQHRSDLVTLGGANAIVVADFNHDGAADLAVTYAQQSAVSILLGAGDGTFLPRMDFLTGIYPTALAAGDFNGDGRLDVVVTNGGDQTFSILLGNGDGTLQAAQNFALGAEPTAVAVQDFNRDGKADVAIVLSETGAVSIIPGRGDGTFPAPQAYGDWQGSWAIAAGDFHGNGKLDLLTTNLVGNSISVFAGAGDGTFDTGAEFPAGVLPVAAGVGDFNRDGRLDVAVVNQACTSLPCLPGSVSVFLGNGDGTLQPRFDYATGPIPIAVMVADFNGDGIPDLAVVNNGFGLSNTVSMFMGKGDGTFLSAGTLVTGNGPTQAVAADFDGNGTLDLAVAYSGGVSVIPGREAGTFGPRSDYPINNGAKAIAVGDFNQDGKPDLAVTTCDSVLVLLGNGNGTFTTGASYVLSSVINPDAILAGDFNGDGKPDLLVGKSTDAVSILVGNGDGTFQPPVDIPAGKLETGWVAGDFAGDGGIDLAAASVGPNAVFVSLNAPVVGLYPAGLNFGGQAAGNPGASAAVTVSNPSGAPLTISGVAASGPFTVVNGCPPSLAPGSNCTLNVSFSPTAPGDASGVLTISDNASGGKQNLPLQGIGIGEPGASVSTSGLSFSPQNVGTKSVAQGVTLTNSGSLTLAVSSVSASGDFTEFDNCVPGLAVGAQCTISVTFAPTESGTRPGLLTIVDGGPSGSQLVSLIGTGVAKPVAGLSVLSLAFNNQLVNSSSSPQTFLLSNSGNASLNISSIDATGDFSASSNCRVSLSPGASCTVSVSFAPAAKGIIAGAVNIIDNAIDSPQSVALSGAGTAPVASPSRSTLIFAGQVVGRTGAGQSLQLTNSGNTPLAISSITLAGPNAGDFSLQNQCSGSLGAGSSCGLAVSFTPSAAGARTATLNMVTSASGGPQVVALNGTGLDFSFTGITTALTVSPGAQAQFHLTVLPGGMQTTLNFSCTGAPAQSSCQVSSATATLDGVTPASLTVSVQTTAPSAALPRMPQLPRGGAQGEIPKTLFLLTLLALTGVAFTDSRRRVAWTFAVLTLSALLLSGCDAGGQANSGTHALTPGTPAGTYTLTVSATSPTMSHSTNLTLTVQN